MQHSICIVTSNRHKFNEIELIAREYGVPVEQCPGLKIEIQGDRLEEIAYKSALLARLYIDKSVLVEDAGLFVEALNGFPGPYSNYVYKTIGISGLLKLMENVENRRACFKSAVALVTDTRLIVTTGEVCGYIARAPRGNMGFGFDPIFIPDGESRTFAEMNTEEKNKYSHRARAVRKAFEAFLGGYSYSNL